MNTDTASLSHCYDKHVYFPESSAEMSASQLHCQREQPGLISALAWITHQPLKPAWQKHLKMQTVF